MKSSGPDALQQWFANQCDGQWEHQHGITIETLDNPGWYIGIDLGGTEIARKKFNRTNHSRSRHDWVECRVASERFEGFGGPGNLGEIIDVFLRWVNE